MGTDYRRLKSSIFSQETVALAVIAQRAIRIAKRARFSKNFWVRTKSDGSILTLGDKLTQKVIMEGALGLDPSSVFIAEEIMLDEDPRCHSPQLEHIRLTPENYQSLFSFRSTHIDDSIDQSVRYARGIPGWSTSEGLMRYGRPQAGVIVAPEDRGGLMIIGEQGKPTMVQDGGGRELRKAELSLWDGKSKPYVGYSDFIVTKPEFEPFWKWFRQNAICLPISSCALGIGLVIAGKLHAHIHAWAPAYDWFGGWVGMLGVNEGSMVFYRALGSLEMMLEPDLYSYHPVDYSTGFCCGHKSVVQMMLEQLGTRASAQEARATRV